MRGISRAASSKFSDDASSVGHDLAEKQEEIARGETSTVLLLKLVVFVVLAASTVGGAMLVHGYAKGNEEAKFLARFESDANKTLDAIGSSFEKTLGAFDSLAATLVAHAEAHNDTWPFVTLPHFALRASKVLPLSNALYVSVLPIVRPEVRRQWETYSHEHNDWVNESMALQEDYEGYYGPVIYEWDTSNIHGIDGELPYNLSRDYLPAWQTFPSIPHYAPYGYDWMTATVTKAMDETITTHHATISEAYLLPKPGDVEAQAESEVWADFYSDYIPSTENSTEPVSDFYYPILNDVSAINVAGVDGYDPSQHEIVGLLAAPFYWRSMIKGNLPTDSKGIVIVFDSPCNDAFTYQIDGINVTYLGVTDKHDTKYDSLRVERTLAEQRRVSPSHAVYSGAPLDTDVCPITMSVYPSDAMQAEFMTTVPIILTLGAVAIFVFTSLVFVLYDFFVERRQKVVLGTATRSTAIVSSLFPSEVRDQLYPTHPTAPETTNGIIKSFLTNKKTEGTDDATAGRYKKLSGSPIASLYKDTTVFFADIVGFTAWSAPRQPTDVFHLLETLYGVFDEIADRRGVFKVETIGDSYVAVAGLPTPRKNHAVVMARFAQDCMDAMAQVTSELETSLGPGTTDLVMRVGLNSGETTAGVLRGAKARFQLFGDTVNTAARMESNGERNRIQVSRATADLIEQSGKGHWLTDRIDLVHAKGKGDMQTYWCNPRAVGSSTEADSQQFNAESAIDTEESQLEKSSETEHSDTEKAGIERAVEQPVVHSPRRVTTNPRYFM